MNTDAQKPAAKSRYRKIEVRMWGDEKFRALSPMPPSGQALWVFLLTGPHTGPIPGLFRSGRAAMAEELDWPVEAFDEAFQEVLSQDMAQADWKAKVVWIPKAISCNRPESPNVVLSWGSEWALIPECDLKREAYEVLKSSIHALGEGFAKAFDKAFEKPSAKPSPKTCRNQEQEQEQEQDKTRCAGVPPSASPAAPPALHSTPPKKPKPDRAAAPTAAIWHAYASAYGHRYGIEPVRNAKVNGQLAQLLARLGAEEAPRVAAFFVSHNNRYYVQKLHAVDCLLNDAEKLRTEWATGRRVTATAANEADRLQQSGDMWAQIIAEHQTMEG
jgi:hypothetical protein